VLRKKDFLDNYHIDWEKDEELYYSFNDFEEEELRGEMKRTGEIAIQRKIKVLQNGGKVVIKLKGNEDFKLYELENIE